MPAIDPLDALEIRTHCPENWDEMEGDDRVRRCELCRLNVYDVSSMTREEALALIREREGRLCVRLRRRPGGTLILRDCGVLRAAARQVRSSVAAVLAIVGLAALAGGAAAPQADRFPKVVEWARGVRPLAPTVNRLFPPPPPPLPPQIQLSQQQLMALGAMGYVCDD